MASLYNAALAQAHGAFIIMLPPDTILAEHALFEMAMAATLNGDLELIFADEDCVDVAGNRSGPRFKTAWDPDLMLGCDAIGHIAALRTASVRRHGGMRADITSEIAHYDLVLRLGMDALPNGVHHIPTILCHRALETPVGWDAEAARHVVQRYLVEAGAIGAHVEPAPLAPDCNRIIFPLPQMAPLVSVIVPIRDKADLLALCADGVLARTDYEPLELLVIDNDSQEKATHDLLARLTNDPRVRVISYPGAFNFAAMNNAAAQQAKGEVIVFLNSDTDVIDAGWLREMVSHAVRPDVGAVGAKLLYADGRI